MGQIKNIKLLIVTDIKSMEKRVVSFIDIMLKTIFAMTLLLHIVTCLPRSKVSPLRLLKKTVHRVDIGINPNFTNIKNLPEKSESKKLPTFVDKGNTSIKVSSGGYTGSIQKGEFKASGVAKAEIDMNLNKGKGVNVNIQLPSGKAQAGPVAANADLSTSLHGGIKTDGKNFESLAAGISGPKASVQAGPVSVGIQS